MDEVLISLDVACKEQNLIERALCEFNVVAIIVHSYKKAMEQLIKRKCRLVILNCFDSHDDLNAVETVKMMKELLPELIIITISEETSLEIERELRKSGIYYHITSPIDEHELREVLAGAITKNIKRNIR